MSAAESTPIDKSEWGPGPWQSEPDRWEGEHEGFPMLAIRQASGGNWCGYVAMPPGHPWHGKDVFREVDADVHGGLTYGDACQGAICHIPKPGEPDDVWWVGFDCHHGGDLASGTNAYWRKHHPEIGLGFALHGGHYRTLDYVQNECRSLAEQAKAASK